MQEENLSLDDIVEQIENILSKRVDLLDREFFDHYCDFYNDQLTECALNDASETLRTFARNLETVDRYAYKDGYHELSGQDVVDLLLTKMSPDDIVIKMLNHSGVALEDNYPNRLCIESVSVGEFEYEVYAEEISELAGLQELLPNRHRLKHDCITVTGYPCDGVLLLLNFPRFISDVSPTLDAALADKAISNLLKDQDGEAV
jgi:hypothetical protein